MRILIVSHHFPPFNTIGAVRIGQIARWLLEFGQDVRVVAAKNQHLPAVLPLEIPSERVNYCTSLDMSWPATLLMGGRNQLLVNGYDPKGPIARIANRLRPLYTNLVHIPDPQIGWTPFAVARGLDLAKWWKPELIYASASPFSSFLAAHFLSKAVGVPWVAEFRDLWCDNPYYPYSGLRRFVDRQFEKTVLGSVSGCVTVTEPLAATLRAITPSPVVVVPNAIDENPEDDSRDRVLRDRVLHIVYTGGLIRGKRDPRPLFEAMKRLEAEGTRCEVEFYGHCLQCGVEVARELGVETSISFNASVPYRESLRLQRQADVLLLLLWDDPRERGTATGKLYEYLGARRPILMIGPRDGVAADIVRCRGVGAVCSSAEEVYQQVRKWVDEKTAAGVIPDVVESATLGMSRRDTVAKLLDDVNTILDVGRRPTLRATTHVES